MERVLGEHFGGPEHIRVLSNSRYSIEDYPMASTTALRKMVNGIENVLDTEEDILLIYITSHGGPKRIVVNSQNFRLSALTAESLKEILAETKARWKIVIISACHSGSFLEALSSDDTLVLTSASADRSSYGCGKKSDLTYFTKALVKNQLEHGVPLVEAFQSAQEEILALEKEEGLEPSLPQIHSSAGVVARLSEFYDLQ